MEKRLDLTRGFDVKRLSLAAFCSVVVLTGVVWKTPQSLYSDPAYQMDALQEYLNRDSHSFNRMATPDPRDLTKNQYGWIIWWPPGPQVVVYPLVSNGVPIGTALRIVSLLCILLGTLGWVRWIALFEIPPLGLFALAVLLPWVRYASNPLFNFSAESLMFGTGSWILVFTEYLCRRWEARDDLNAAEISLAGLLGLAMGLRYGLKYSAGFTTVGIIAFVAWRFRHRVPTIVWGWLVMTVGFLGPVFLISYLNWRLGDAVNGVTRTAGFHFTLGHFISVFANLALGLADAESMWKYLLVHPNHPLLTSEIFVRVIALPFGLLLFALLLRSRASARHEKLALVSILSSMVCIVFVWSISRSADHSSRHIATATMAVLPWTLQCFFREWKKPSVYRSLWAFLIAVFVVIPLLYGVVSVFAKVKRTPSDYVLDQPRIYNPLLASHDLRGVVARLTSDWNPKTDVWYLPEPISALNVPGRTIVRASDFMTTEELRQDSFVSSAPVRMRILLPPKFEQNGKGDIIRNAFPQAGPWTSRPVEGCNYTLWESWLKTEKAK